MSSHPAGEPGFHTCCPSWFSIGGTSASGAFSSTPRKAEMSQSHGVLNLGVNAGAAISRR